MRMLKEAAQQQQLAGTLQLCRQLAVSYAGLILTLDMFPQVGGVWWVCLMGADGCLPRNVCFVGEFEASQGRSQGVCAVAGRAC